MISHLREIICHPVIGAFLIFWLLFPIIVTRVISYAWTLPVHGLFGLLLLLTVYFPKRIAWTDGALDVVVRWKLIPSELSGGFVTGAQTHGFFIFYRDEKAANSRRLRTHERRHVLQCRILGGILFPLIYGLDFLWGLVKHRNVLDAYENIWFERNARQAEDN